MPALDFLSVFNAQPGATLLLSPDWVILGTSDDYLAATLTQRDTIVGQFIFEAFPDNPQTPEANAVANVRASLQQVMATKRPHEMAPQHYDVPDRTQPGQFVERYWQARHTPVLDAQGQVQCIIQSVQDITTSRQAERQLLACMQAEQEAFAVAEQQRQRFREVLTQMPAYIAVYQGPDHIYQFVNPAYQSLFPHRSFLGRPFREGTPESVELGVVALFDQVYRTGEPVYLREMEGWFDFHGNGQPVQVFLNISLHPLRDVQGHIDGVMDFTYDVSEQVRARQQVEHLNQALETRVQERTQELRESNAHLQRTNADLDTFVYTASHDLKAPITNIEGLLLTLHEVLPAEVQQTQLVAEPLRLLQDTVSRFRITITQLSDLVRLQQSQAGPTQPVMLEPLLEAVCHDLAAEIKAAEATVHLHIPAELRINFIPATLRSIVYNLLSNSVKYRAPERPAHIWVRAEQQAGVVTLTVQDNGLGLNQAQQGRLFQVFQRLHTHVEGSGVGLYMIKRLIENGGGTIAVSSEPGVGTTFIVAFRA
ncbi:sensor histidine kinase [Hymenobacter puniceus]|uniref:sensor histidine kinase n=1 Tax=Hymenobacter sp. BT190 TaxID=2763505 RepID=UPI0016510977|nr:ATP-binding protein [Hymenobacter sp. BT190]MBC6698863.1 PAS domain-containing protein [Hymenobacter sp. BT190]